MITDERQYIVARRKVNRFVDALAEFETKAGKRTGVDPRLIRAEGEAIEAQLVALREEVEEYERARGDR